MKIVIPMAGQSRRFQKKGYKTPKAFIDIDGYPMIQWVCNMFSPKDEFIFITLNEYLEIDEYNEILTSCAKYTTLVGIDSHENGPVHSILCANDHINDSEPIIISYCDFYQHWNYERFLMKVSHYDGGIAVFRGFHPASFGDTYYAYIKPDENGNMVELREKHSFTDYRHEEFASTGVYYINTWQMYKSYAQELLDKKQTVGNEYYASLIFNPMVQDNKKVALYEIEKFICWGTPEDLEQYLFWSDYFRNDVKWLSKRTFFKND